MKVERLNISNGGSCNFCSRGKLSTTTHAALDYPYTKTTSFHNDNGGGLKAYICDDCLDELVAKTKMEIL